MKGIIKITLLLLSVSCASYEQCMKKYGSVADTVYMPIETTVVVEKYIPPDSNVLVFQSDTIIPGVRYSSDSSDILIEYWKDKYTDLYHIKAKKKEIQIRDTITIKDTIPCPVIKMTNKKKKRPIVKLLDNYKTYAALLLPLIILLIIFLKKKE